MPTVDLSWTDNSDNEDAFRVYRTTTSSPSFPADYTEINTVPADQATYTDTNAPSGGTVYYAVTAFNAGGESGATTDSVQTEIIVTESASQTASGTVEVSDAHIVAETASVQSSSVTVATDVAVAAETGQIDRTGSVAATDHAVGIATGGSTAMSIVAMGPSTATANIDTIGVTAGGAVANTDVAVAKDRPTHTITPAVTITGLVSATDTLATMADAPIDAFDVGRADESGSHTGDVAVSGVDVAMVDGVADGLVATSMFLGMDTTVASATAAQTTPPAFTVGDVGETMDDLAVTVADPIGVVGTGRAGEGGTVSDGASVTTAESATGSGTPAAVLADATVDGADTSLAIAHPTNTATPMVTAMEDGSAIATPLTAIDAAPTMLEDGLAMADGSVVGTVSGAASTATGFVEAPTAMARTTQSSRTFAAASEQTSLTAVRDVFVLTSLYDSTTESMSLVATVAPSPMVETTAGFETADALGDSVVGVSTFITVIEALDPLEATVPVSTTDVGRATTSRTLTFEPTLSLVGVASADESPSVVWSDVVGLEPPIAVSSDMTEVSATGLVDTDTTASAIEALATTEPVSPTIVGGDGRGSELVSDLTVGFEETVGDCGVAIESPSADAITLFVVNAASRDVAFESGLIQPTIVSTITASGDAASVATLTTGRTFTAIEWGSATAAPAETATLAHDIATFGHSVETAAAVAEATDLSATETLQLLYETARAGIATDLVVGDVGAANERPEMQRVVVVETTDDAPIRELLSQVATTEVNLGVGYATTAESASIVGSHVFEFPDGEVFLISHTITGVKGSFVPTVVLDETFDPSQSVVGSTVDERVY